jgi:hypothetical protein
MRGFANLAGRVTGVGEHSLATVVADTCKSAVPKHQAEILGFVTRENRHGRMPDYH